MSDIRQIVKMQLEGISAMMKEKGLRLEYTEYATEYLCSKGYDPAYGARPVKRLLQKELVNELAREILKGEINKEKPIIVDYFDEVLVFRN